MKKRQSLLRRAEQFIPSRYKTVALINTGLLAIISIFIIVLVIQNFSMRSTIKEIAKTLKDQEITIALMDHRVGKLEKKVNDLEIQVRQQMELIGEISYASNFIRYRRPELSFKRVWWKSQKLVYGAKRYAIPLNFAIATAWAESDFHWNALGPCGEKSMVQVMRSTFYGMRPNGDWNDLNQVLDAGLHYLRVCYQRQQQRAPSREKVVFAYYNAGSKHDPDVALKRSWRHMRRIDYVMWQMAEVERMRVA